MRREGGGRQIVFCTEAPTTLTTPLAECPLRQSMELRLIPIPATQSYPTNWSRVQDSQESKCAFYCDDYDLLRVWVISEIDSQCYSANKSSLFQLIRSIQIHFKHR